MILHGDCMTLLATLPRDSFHVCVTSPPYWSLRDYGVPPTMWGGNPRCEHEWVGAGAKEGFAGKTRWQHHLNGKGQTNAKHPTTVTRKSTPEAWTAIDQGAFCSFCGAWRGVLGLEPTPELYLAHIVQLFREVRRVLRRDGTLWVNLGDSYANDAKGPRGTDRSTLTGSKTYERQHESSPPVQKGWRGSDLKIKKKDLIGIPWLVAFALRDDGWYFRRDIIWDKPNPKPESALDRPSTSHEYLFLFSKRASYYYDQVAVREYASTGNHPHRNIVRPEPSHVPREHGLEETGLRKTAGAGAGRNCRSVWRLQVRPYKEAHFATFPEELPARCIRAGSSEHGACGTCGAPFRRLVQKGDWSPTQLAIAGANAKGEYKGTGQKKYSRGRAEDPSDLKRRILAGMRERVTIGWAPTCKCKQTAPVVPCHVLDPMAGSSSTGAAALKLGRDFTGCELNPEYIDMGARRLQKAAEPPKPKKTKAATRDEVDEPLPFADEVPA